MWLIEANALMKNSGGSDGAFAREQHRCRSIGGLDGKYLEARRNFNRRRMLRIESLA